MTENNQQENKPSGSKRSAKEAFGQKLMTDVPEHFNYGVFYDDGYDYMKHMKSLKEFVEDPDYTIIGEDRKILDDYVPPTVEPVLIDEEVDEDFEIPSDDELIEELGELEDNFIELAGGKRVKGDDNDEGDEEEASTHEDEREPSPSFSNLPIEKVRMVERYLFPDGIPASNHKGFQEESNSDATALAAAAARKGRPLSEVEELAEKEFSRLMRKAKSRSGFSGSSVISGTSVMSESLQSAFEADQIMISKKRPTSDPWKRPDPNLKATTLQCLEEMSEPAEDEDPFKDWVGEEKPVVEDITSNQQPVDKSSLKQPEMLVIPKRRQGKGVMSPEMNVSFTQSEQEDDSDEEGSQDGANDVNLHRRMKGETPEQKKARKAALRVHKRLRQVQKKINKETFKREQMLISKNGKSSSGGGRVVVD